ncbi:MAG: LamG-like jellyroll fold domain-containing protein [Luteolibacter sp.]
MEKHSMELLALVRDGEATPKQISELNTLLRGDASLLKMAREQNKMHSLLSVVLEDELSSERRIHGIMAEVKDADADRFVEGVEHRLMWRRWRMRAMAVAAVLMIALIPAIYLSQKVAKPSTMATLLRADGVTWTESVIGIGTALEAGASVKIDQGMLEIDLDGRGRLILEGPAHLDFPEEGRATLTQGRVVMRATEKGHGYMIETPQGNIIDIGTEFGVTVGSDGLVETHVIDGSIEAIPKGGKSVTLVRNDAMKMGPGGGESITADPGQFYTEMPPQHGKAPRYIRWSFDEGEGKIVGSEGELASSISNKADMVLQSMGKGALPSWIPGPSPAAGTALSFDGEGSYAESAYRGIGGGKPRTVCFWVKVPDDFSATQGYGIVSWGKHDPHRPGEVWQLSANPEEKDGPIGRLRLGLMGGQIIGSTDLRDGKWHHIGVVMYGGSQPNVGTHVILYVDGELEKIPRRALQEVRTEIDEAEHGVWLGRNSSFRETGQKHPLGKFFRGGLDELYIFDAALSQSEVQSLMRKHQAAR